MQIVFNQSSFTDTVRLDDALILHYCLSATQVQARFHEGGWYEHADTSMSHDTTGGSGSTFQWSKPLQMPSGILGMCWANNSTGYACGQQGAIYKTVDTGHTWQQQNQTSTQCDLYSISFMQSNPNQGMGVAVGFSNGPIILTTTDGGKAWIRDTIPPGIATIRDVITGVGTFPYTFAVGSDSLGDGVILYSNYWGYWGIARRTPKPLYAIADDGQTNYIDPTDPMIAVGDGGQIFVATTWKPNPDSLQWADYSTGSENLRGISLSQSGAFFNGVAVTDNGSTLWSIDVGKTWAERSDGVSSYVSNSGVYAAGGLEAWISGSNIGRTVDGGVTWTNGSPASGLTWTCISALDANRVAFLGSGGLYWLTR